MRTDLEQYYTDLRGAISRYAEKVTKNLGSYVTATELIKNLPKFTNRVDATLFPCLTYKGHNFYLVTKYDIEKNNFGQTSNEKVIPITKTKSIVIVAI